MSLLGALVALKEQTHNTYSLAVVKDAATAQILYQIELLLITTIARTANNEVKGEVNKLNKQNSIP